MGCPTFDLETEAFLASGVSEGELGMYSALFDRLQSDVLRLQVLSQDSVTRAGQVFDFLWRENPNRYRVNGNYRLHDLLRCRFDKSASAAGNCLGLTVLYNCLLKRLGVEVKALFMEMAFGIGPHVLSWLPAGKTGIRIEHVFRDGFDYRGHRERSSPHEWGERELVADIYLSRGNDCFEKKAFEEAKIFYDRAIDLNPEYERALINRAVVLEVLSSSGCAGSH